MLLCAVRHVVLYSCFFFNDPPTTEIYTLSLHDALPILPEARKHELEGLVVEHSIFRSRSQIGFADFNDEIFKQLPRSEEHTSELQSQFHLVCRLLLEKKKKKKTIHKIMKTQKLDKYKAC